MAFDLKEEYILDAEEKLGTILPMTYKQIMKQNNGGTIYLDEDDWELFSSFPKLQFGNNVHWSDNNKIKPL